MNSFLTKANAQIVPPHLLAETMGAHSQMNADDRKDVTEQLLCIIKTVHSVEIAEDKARLGLAIDFRIMALCKFLGGDSGRSLVPRYADGSQNVPWELIQCAAQVPLIEGDDGRATFDESELLKRYLSLVPVAASA